MCTAIEHQFYSDGLTRIKFPESSDAKRQSLPIKCDLTQLVAAPGDAACPLLAGALDSVDD